MDPKIKEEIEHWLQENGELSISNLQDLLRYRQIIPPPRYSTFKINEVIWSMILTGELELNNEKRVRLK